MRQITAILSAITCILQASTFTQCVMANESIQKKNPVSLTANSLLSAQVKQGLTYLITQQQNNGGWSQGQESTFMGHADTNITELPNVGDTCMASLALMQTGNYPNSGTYSKNVDKAISFICSKIESADYNSLSVTDIKGTRLQMKLGPHIDTFLASLALSEVKGHMLNKSEEQQVTEALNKVIMKIEKHQDENGQIASGGWAPVHAQAFATKGLNRAKQAGISVSDGVLARAEEYAKNNFDGKTANFKAVGSPVPLYSAGATLSELQESINTNNQLEVDEKKILSSKKSSQSERDVAQTKLHRFESTKVSQKQAVDAVINRLNDDGFMRGFGCNGGEEFLSYLDISETLKASESNKWDDWNKKITANLYRIQNNDGSWMGQHCITSRTFCTAAAILVLTVDREQSPVVKKLRA